MAKVWSIFSALGDGPALPGRKDAVAASNTSGSPARGGGVAVSIG
jgi:hypothetical protein